MQEKRALRGEAKRTGVSICPMCTNRGCSWVFSGLSESERVEFSRLVRSVAYEAGDALYREGEPAFGFFIVCAGKIKLVKGSGRGKRQILKIVGPSEILGEENLFDGDGYATTAKALEPTKAKFIKREEFLDFIKRHPALALKLAEKISRELKGFQAKLMETAYEGVKGRMARILVTIADRYGRPEAGGIAIGIKLSRADLAEMAGISTETAIRTLGELGDRGLITLDARKILIRDRNGLEQLAEPLPAHVVENLL